MVADVPDPDPPGAPHPLVQRWESLESGVQAAIAFPALAIFLTLVHLTILGQPFWRGVGYGLFWAVPATVLVVVATAHERRKRRRAAAPPPSSDDPSTGPSGT
jgi:hypothetical protein